MAVAPFTNHEVKPVRKSLYFLTVLLLVVGYLIVPGRASSHREAPLISGDPQADNTDVYAFVSPDAPDTVTLIASYIPFENPQGGPNFYRFGDNVQYDINVDNNGDAVADITFRLRFTSQVRNGSTFLYNTGPIRAIDDPNRNMFQTYTLSRIEGGVTRYTAGPMFTMPDNVGAASTPNYGGNGSGIYDFIRMTARGGGSSRDRPMTRSSSTSESSISFTARIYPRPATTAWPATTCTAS